VRADDSKKARRLAGGERYCAGGASGD